MNPIDDFFRQCDLRTTTFASLAAALGTSSCLLRITLDGTGISFNRRRQEEARRRVKLAVEGGAEDVAAIVAEAGISAAMVYRHFATLYKATPVKYLAKRRGSQYAVA